MTASMAETPALAQAYKEFAAYDPGFYVYQLWAGDECLYVGMVGVKGPRRPLDRIQEHSRVKPWWPAVTRVEIAKCEDRKGALREERDQAAKLKPAHSNEHRRRRVSTPKPAVTPPAPVSRWEGPQLPELSWEWSNARPGGFIFAHTGERTISSSAYLNPWQTPVFLRVGADQIFGVTSVADAKSLAFTFADTATSMIEIWAWQGDKTDVMWKVQARCLPVVEP